MANQAYVISGMAPAAAQGRAASALLGLVGRLRTSRERVSDQPLRSTSCEMPSFAVYMDKVQPSQRAIW